MGTSFAAPLVTRTAFGLRSMFTSSLHPLTLRCILIHTARQDGNDLLDVGYGRIIDEDSIAICPDNTARVIYQGELPPKRFLRARIPIPNGLNCMVTITATLCYATEISAADPVNYTNSGVEITYRPNENKHDKNKETGKYATNAKSSSFFSSGSYRSEEERRLHHQKWETVLHSSKRVRASSLHNPCFDLHFIPRMGVSDVRNARPIRYSMIISVEAPKYPEIYDRILADFPKLQPLNPIPVQAHV